jgi:hypothetical protein
MMMIEGLAASAFGNLGWPFVLPLRYTDQFTSDLQLGFQGK